MAVTLLNPEGLPKPPADVWHSRHLEALKAIVEG